MLTDFWVRIIAENQPIAPPVPQRRFLDFFCPICLTRPSPRNGHRSSELEGDIESCAPSMRSASPGNLEDAILEGTAACESGANPCASSAARFAALVQLTHVRPWDGYQFITQNIAPDRWWVRNCIGCDRAFVSESRASRKCHSCGSKKE
jgi:hypothetical protein